jgi:hypothetical protein
MAKAKKKNKSNSAARGGETFEWAKWSDARILNLRMCDLKLSIEGTVLEDRIGRLREELQARDLRVRPYFWLSDDWFTPSECTGVAIPFYLAHKRLMDLEKTLIGEVEGGTYKWCMKLLRHEAGHVVDHAFKLSRRRDWKRYFGHSSDRYPRYYRPNPKSRRYVQHLEYWYAQSHPDEDFAETFATWLTPRSTWRKEYKGWPAIRKLEYVDWLMSEIAGEKPCVRTRARIDTLRTLKKTLKEHYKRKRRTYGSETHNFFDKDLRRLFSMERRKGSRAASAVIRDFSSEVVALVSEGTGESTYLVNHVRKDIIERCRELRLFARGPKRRLKESFTVLLTKHVINALFRNRRWVEM